MAPIILHIEFLNLKLLRYVHSTNEKESRLVGSELGLCVRVKQHVYQRIVVFSELALEQSN